MLLRATLSLLGLAVLLPCSTHGQGEAARLDAVLEQNRKLQEELRAQARTIDALAAQLAKVQAESARHEDELKALRERTDGADAGRDASARGEATVRISGEAGLAFFRSGGEGEFPQSTFRLDDAKVLLEAKVWRDVYFVSELDLFLRETGNANVQFGEVFAEFENVSGHWGQDRLVNVRVGRFNTPFGEEYQVRGVLDNPLITHSVADVWGLDQGLELYGSAGPFSYVAAVQNGGFSTDRDFTSDKALIGRIGYGPASWLSLSASAMRTGDLTPAGDSMSAVWFGNGFFRGLGTPAAPTLRFHADLYELDATLRWSGGSLAAAGGWGRFGDEGGVNHSRDLSYYSVEAQQRLAGGLYGAVRYSGVDVDGGYPLAGLGRAGPYFYNPFAPLTERLHRLSLGFGYRFGPPLVLKLEYAFERGRTTDGDDRDHEDLLATELGLRF